jgi:nucleotidyltransferase/DNA polymerase involved in DNA repair
MSESSDDEQEQEILMNDITTVSETTSVKNGDGNNRKSSNESRQHDEKHYSKCIMHVDVDCFYAQSAFIRNYPAGEDEPPIAMRQKHIIVTANYPARELGVKKLMSYEAAVNIDNKLGGGVLNFIDASDLTLFREDSFIIETAIRKWSRKHSHPCPVHKRGMDEFDLNVSGHGDGLHLALDLQSFIFSETSFTVSVGYGPSAFLAKLAAGRKKPNGVSTLSVEAASKFLHKLPMRIIPGLGSNAARQMRRVILNANGIDEPDNVDRKERVVLTCGNLLKTPMVELKGMVGEGNARLFLRLAQGLDDSEIIDNGNDMKKVTTVEDSFKSGTVTNLSSLDRQCAKIAGRLLSTMAEENKRVGMREGANLRVTVREKGIRGRRSKSVPWPRVNVDANVIRRLAMAEVSKVISTGKGGGSFNCTLMNLGVEWIASSQSSLSSSSSSSSSSKKRKGGGGGGGGLKKYFTTTAMVFMAMAAYIGGGVDGFCASANNIQIQDLVDKRKLARSRGEYAAADVIKAQLEASGVFLQDQLGGGSTWSMDEPQEHVNIEGMSILGLAHAACGCVEDEDASEEDVEAIGKAALERIGMLREVRRMAVKL